MSGKNFYTDLFAVFRFLNIFIISIQLSHTYAQKTFPVLDARTSLYYYSDSTLAIKSGSVMFDVAELYCEEVAAVRFQGKWGFINTSQEFVITPKFMEAVPFKEGFSAVIDEYGISNFCRHDGSLLCPSGFDISRSFRGNMAAVAINNKWGYVDSNGVLVIPMIYEKVLDFSEGLAAVKKDGKWGFINKSGNLMIPAIYDGVTSFGNQLAGVVIEGSLSYINTNGETMFTLPQIKDFTNINTFCNGMVWVHSSEEWQLLDVKGIIIGKMNCETILPCSEGYSLFRSGGQWGFIDVKGKVIIPAQFQEVLPFENGFAKVFTDGKYYFIDIRGKEYIHYQE